MRLYENDNMKVNAVNQTVHNFLPKITYFLDFT